MPINFEKSAYALRSQKHPSTADTLAANIAEWAAAFGRSWEYAHNYAQRHYPAMLCAITGRKGKL